MAPPDDDSVEHSNRETMACANCKKNKKGCDKKLPACGNCSRKRTTCDYGQAASYSHAVGNTTWGERVWTAEGSLASSTAAAHIRETDTTLTSPDSLPDIMSGFLSSTNLHISDTVDRRVHAQVSRIIDGIGLYADDITSRYFNGIHKWLPIISRKRFNRRLLAYQACPSAAFAILLISTYERGHNLFEAAYVSIGTCARMAFAAGLQQRRIVVEESDIEAWSQSEEERNLWWGIVICDRIIGCEPSMFGRPLAVDHPRSNDELPLEAADLDRGTHQPFAKVRQLVSTQSTGGIGAFGREAQATYLLSRVLDLVNAARLSLTMPKDILGLDSELQAFLSTLVAESAGTCRLYCGATAMCIAALFILHEAVLSQSSNIIGLNKCKNCSTNALSTIARIVIDMSYSFNRDISNSDINALSSACSHIIRAAWQHIKIVDDLKGDIWNQDFDTLKKTLEYFHHRWTIAGKQLHVLNFGFKPNIPL